MHSACWTHWVYVFDALDALGACIVCIGRAGCMHSAPWMHRARAVDALSGLGALSALDALVELGASI